VLKTTEADDIKIELKSFSTLGFPTENDLNSAITYVAAKTEILIKDIIGLSYYEYLKGLNGAYLDIYQKSVYYAEVNAICRDIMNHIAKKYQVESNGGSFSLPDYSESSPSGAQWFMNDQMRFNNEYIKFMYIAGYKVNQIATMPNYYQTQECKI